MENEKWQNNANEKRPQRPRFTRVERAYSATGNSGEHAFRPQGFDTHASNGEHQGGFSNNRQGGFNRQGGAQGGYNRQGGFNRQGNAQGGFNRQGDKVDTTVRVVSTTIARVVSTIIVRVVSTTTVKAASTSVRAVLDCSVSVQPITILTQNTA